MLAQVSDKSDPLNECRKEAKDKKAAAIAKCDPSSGYHKCKKNAKAQFNSEKQFCNTVVAPCRNTVDGNLNDDILLCLGRDDEDSCIADLEADFDRLRDIRIDQCVATKQAEAERTARM